jgi:hypothetical protein
MMFSSSTFYKWRLFYFHMLSHHAPFDRPFLLIMTSFKSAHRSRPFCSAHQTVATALECYNPVIALHGGSHGSQSSARNNCFVTPPALKLLWLAVASPAEPSTPTVNIIAQENRKPLPGPDSTTVPWAQDEMALLWKCSRLARGPSCKAVLSDHWLAPELPNPFFISSSFTTGRRDWSMHKDKATVL